MNEYFKRAALLAAVACGTAWRWMRANVGAGELVQIAGLCALSIGSGLIYRPAGFIVAGISLLYLSTFHAVVLNRMMK